MRQANVYTTNINRGLPTCTSDNKQTFQIFENKLHITIVSFTTLFSCAQFDPLYSTSIEKKIFNQQYFSR